METDVQGTNRRWGATAAMPGWLPAGEDPGILVQQHGERNPCVATGWASYTYVQWGGLTWEP